MKLQLLVLALALRVCWGPGQCGTYLGRHKAVAGGREVVNYYVVRLKNGTVALIEPDLILNPNPKEK